MTLTFSHRHVILPALGVVLVSALFGLGGCALRAPTLVAEYVKAVPNPNALIEARTIWNKRKPLLITLRQPLTGIERPISLLAVHDGLTFSILAVWPDASPANDASRMWVWSRRSKQYFLEQSPTDTLSFKFALEGAQEACMMTGEEGVYDVWLWRSGWNDLFGYADDRRLIITNTPPEDGEARSYGAVGGIPIYVRWVDDAGRKPYREIRRPRERKYARMPAIGPEPPTGSAGDVLARGFHHEGLYKVEIKRALRNPNKDDYQFRGKGPHYFSIAITDNDDGQAHYTSEMIRLVFH